METKSNSAKEMMINKVLWLRGLSAITIVMCLLMTDKIWEMCKVLLNLKHILQEILLLVRKQEREIWGARKEKKTPHKGRREEEEAVLKKERNKRTDIPRIFESREGIQVDRVSADQHATCNGISVCEVPERVKQLHACNSTPLITGET